MPEVANDHNVYILGAGFSCEAGMPFALVRPELGKHSVLRVFKGKTLDFFCRDRSDLRSIGREPESQFRIGS
jgi:hypothetical protein